jgi:cation transport ATPase
MADTILPNAQSTISYLKRLHIIPYVLSGDHVRIVKSCSNVNNLAIYLISPLRITFILPRLCRL